VISGIHLVDSLGRPANPQLGFQLQGTHWVLEFDSEVQRFAEEVTNDFCLLCFLLVLIFLFPGHLFDHL
jgi:hypothetical protein